MDAVSFRESIMAKPKNIRAVHPATPRIVINILDLYLKRFLAVIFCINERRFHIGLILSSKIVEPFSGLSGSKSLAGVSLTVSFEVKKTVRLTKIDDRIIDPTITAKELTYSTSRISKPVE